MRNLNEIYAALPVRLLPWYRENARDLPWRRSREPYRVWVSEIMLQQTRVEAVVGYYNRFMEAFPNVQALAAAEESRVLKLWEGLGYYSRARNLQKTAKLLVETRGGRFPDTAAELQKLPGIGAYTAGAVASICFERPSAAVDGNVLRIIARITAEARAVDLPAVRREIAARLEAVYPAGNCGMFTQALMELGACVCTPKNPDCARCPMRGVCAAQAAGRALHFPVKLPKSGKARGGAHRVPAALRGDLRHPPPPRNGPARRAVGVPELRRRADRGRGRAVGRSAGRGAVRRRPRGPQDPHLHAYPLGDDGLCARLRRKGRRVCVGGFAALTETYALPTAFRMFLEALGMPE